MALAIMELVSVLLIILVKIVVVVGVPMIV